MNTFETTKGSIDRAPSDGHIGRLRSEFLILILCIPCVLWCSFELLRLKTRHNYTGWLFLLLCALAALRPLLKVSVPRDEVGSDAGFPGWIAAPLPNGAMPLKLSPRDVKFAEQFPGRIAAYSDDQSTWIVRWVTRPTRKLHPASDCLRATGYTVAPEPIFAEANGSHWGVVSASRGPEKLIIHERIIDANGREFTDVSAWFWSAILEKSQGPWWCLTRIESDSPKL